VRFRVPSLALEKQKQTKSLADFLVIQKRNLCRMACFLTITERQKDPFSVKSQKVDRKKTHSQQKEDSEHKSHPMLC
jgi:hypothetical protein